MAAQTTKENLLTADALLKHWRGHRKLSRPPQRFSEVDKAFGQWKAPGFATIQYAIDNEIHHRGQGYVYLRALGIEPPPFRERD